MANPVDAMPCFMHHIIIDFTATIKQYEKKIHVINKFPIKKAFYKYLLAAKQKEKKTEKNFETNM